ncbi:putative GATA-binding transcription factor [Tieghemostelium lacteum]|uniref:Putative GATA-binding transcription factor n=1 Tax=Tieghemostelium lacteum TaxID=361077 RepID=A0A152AA61_TIELA|nr:putative GATA-binding transcription factor [Tieghemostelium lacteum]|eukprot:KYR03113.1 putative GATA-binding transcription factor [Tieghemostelium lacteum]
MLLNQIPKIQNSFPNTPQQQQQQQQQQTPIIPHLQPPNQQIPPLYLNHTFHNNNNNNSTPNNNSTNNNNNNSNNSTLEKKWNEIKIYSDLIKRFANEATYLTISKENYDDLYNMAFCLFKSVDNLSSEYKESITPPQNLSLPPPPPTTTSNINQKRNSFEIYSKTYMENCTSPMPGAYMGPHHHMGQLTAAQHHQAMLAHGQLPPPGGNEITLDPRTLMKQNQSPYEYYYILQQQQQQQQQQQLQQQQHHQQQQHQQQQQQQQPQTHIIQNIGNNGNVSSTGNGKNLSSPTASSISPQSNNSSPTTSSGSNIKNKNGDNNSNNSNGGGSGGGGTDGDKNGKNFSGEVFFDDLAQEKPQRRRRRTIYSSRRNLKCHLCEVTETPEWRRGPDGDHTLCNACGLHYAKAQKKLQKKKKKNWKEKKKEKERKKKIPENIQLIFLLKLAILKTPLQWMV